MKKLFLVLSVLVLAATISYADMLVHIGTVTNFSGNIMVKHGNNQAVQIHGGSELYVGDEIWFLKSGKNDWVELRDLCQTGWPIYRINQSDVVATPAGMYWNPILNQFVPLTIINGGEGSILIVPKDGFPPNNNQAPELEK